ARVLAGVSRAVAADEHLALAVRLADLPEGRPQLAAHAARVIAIVGVALRVAGVARRAAVVEVGDGLDPLGKRPLSARTPFIQRIASARLSTPAMYGERITIATMKSMPASMLPRRLRMRRPSRASVWLKVPASNWNMPRPP